MPEALLKENIRTGESPTFHSHTSVDYGEKTNSTIDIYTSANGLKIQVSLRSLGRHDRFDAPQGLWCYF
jgi:hypothetical protein